MSGVDEQSISCPTCSEVPKEFYLSGWKVWYIPDVSQYRRGLKCSVICDTNPTIEYVLRYILCQSCQYRIYKRDNSEIFDRIRNLVLEAISMGEYYTWDDFMEVQRSR